MGEFLLGIYIHIPFCKKKCSYCNFYSINHNDELEEKFFNSLFKEIESKKEIQNKVDSIYFGGGTPSAISLKKIEKTIAILNKTFKIQTNCEITLEANPTTTTKEKLLTYKKIGINRISFGVQSFVNDELEKLQRTHNEKTARETIENAIKTNFENISIDLMLGIPLQTKKSLKKTLDIATSFQIDHISLYQLKIEPNTKFYKNPPKNLMKEDEVASLYLFSCEFLEKNNFLQYEISNFSKKSKESRHNIKYWTLEEYLGFGPSAHSFSNNKRFYHKNSLVQYIENPTHTIEEKIDLNFEWFILNLRLKKGIPFSKLKEKNFLNKKFKEKILKLQKENLIEKNKDALKLTVNGMLLQNSIILYLQENI